MKVAVPTINERVDDHFGHCDHYTIFTIENNKVVNRETMASPQGCGCKSGIAADLQKISLMLIISMLFEVAMVMSTNLWSRIWMARSLIQASAAQSMNAAIK